MTGDYHTLYRSAREIKKEGEDEYADSVLQLAIRNQKQREREDVADRMADEAVYQEERDTYYAEAQYAPVEGPERDYYYA